MMEALRSLETSVSFYQHVQTADVPNQAQSFSPLNHEVLHRGVASQKNESYYWQRAG
jgi:hypothetical protein